MFPASETPRVFSSPLGVDFSQTLLDGLRARLAGQPPEALARVTIFVNTERLARRLRLLLSASGPTFMPRLLSITAIPNQPELLGLPPSLSPLALRLTLSQLVQKLLDQRPGLAPRSAVFDLADSLAELMGEMQEEGVSTDSLSHLPTGNLAQHWRSHQEFLTIASQIFSGEAARITPEMRQSLAVDRLAELWQNSPPRGPVLVAGSTGSRGTTARLMRLVASLPQGAVVLPGSDPYLSREIGQDLMTARRAQMAGEDHPQFRHVKFCTELGLDFTALPLWDPSAKIAAPERNAWISLALRPAPVTDAWREESMKLDAAATAFARVTLVQAATPRAEAEAIALRLRQAAAEGQKAALVSPDRLLTRQVAAHLARWSIIPDDSAGVPLDQTPPGRLLAQTAGLLTGRVDSVDLLALLKHPLTHTGADRNTHLRRTRDMELQLLRGKTAVPAPHRVRAWAEERNSDPEELAADMAWADWVCEAILSAPRYRRHSFADFVAAHVALTEAIAAGSSAEGSGDLWEQENGQAAWQKFAAIEADAGFGGKMEPREYRDMIRAILSQEETRSPLKPDANIMIWGAMEARVQGADLMILAGLNEGVWPATDQNDPWLSRGLRAEAGLRLPDRRIGLSAHDFQQAAAASEVWLTRAVRNAEAETVPSRWLNRLSNLLQGAHPDVFEAMRARGDAALRLAAQVQAPRATDIADASTRDAPAPPQSARPKRLSVTDIEKLVRDPYAIYARRVLRLSPLDPLRPTADARLKGTLLHEVAYAFVDATRDGLPEDPGALFMQIGQEKLATAEDWPVARQLWLAALSNTLPHFLEGEARRREFGRPWQLETKGEMVIAPLGLTLSAQVDRIDLRPDGTAVIYDYKSGSLPTAKQERAFNQQLQLEAVMASHGAFSQSQPIEPSFAAYLGLSGNPATLEIGLTREDVADVEEKLHGLLAKFLDPDHGFAPRRAMQQVSYASDYQHLARYGEWDDSSPIVVRQVGR